MNRRTEVSEHGQAVAEAARSLVGARRLVVDGRRYNLDCSGTILAAYHRAGIDLFPHFLEERGNGVRRLYGIAEEHPRPVDTENRLPLPGDLVFWDNTYDRNGNGRWDDDLTHAGIVVSVDDDGTIHYVHHNYRRGIVVEQMNLRAPDDTTRNSAMRMRGSPDGNGLWLSSHLFRDAGSPYMIANG